MDYRQRSFSASLDVVKLFTALSTGALGFSIGLTAQSTTNYPPGFRNAIIAGWFIFFFSVIAGIWSQMSAVSLLKRGAEDPNDSAYRIGAALSVLSFAIGVGLISVVLLLTAPYGASGQPVVVSSPQDAISRSMHAVQGPVSKVTTTEYLRGIDPARADRATWHVTLEMLQSAGKSVPKIFDIYIDPISGCTYVVQGPAVRKPGSARCLGF